MNCMTCICMLNQTINSYTQPVLLIGVGAGPVLAGPLSVFKVKIKFHFCKKQVMNRSASVIFRLVRLIILLYNR